MANSRLVRGGGKHSSLLHNVLKKTGLFFHKNFRFRFGLLATLLVAMYYPLLFINDSWGLAYILYVVAAQFFIACTFAFFASFITNETAYKIFSSIILVCICTHSLLLATCLISTHAPLSDDITAAILATNANETSEFVSSYVDTKVILSWIGMAAALVLTWAIKRKTRIEKARKVLCIAITAMFAASACLTFHNKAVMQETAIGLAASTVEISKTSRIKVKRSHPKLTVKHEGQPPLVIWIIGEALTNHHCSIYGYSKNTNPLLQKKVDNGDVLLFRNVKSAGTHTQESFQLMMSTYEKAQGDKVKWNECTMLPDVARAAGYHTAWLSNQSKKGLYDNVVGQYSELCDTNIFIGNRFAGMLRVNLDGELLPVLKSMLKHSANREFCIVHLMGCHQKFECRYPKSFARFSEKDYPERPIGQRSKVAAYDNAVVYNDFVVNAMFDMVKQRDAIVIYAPDHGLDIYESHPDYAGHAKTNNPIGLKAAHDIPFLVFATEPFRRQHPDITARLQRNTETEFDMENMIYLLMDIMQCDFVNGKTKTKSLARN